MANIFHFYIFRDFLPVNFLFDLSSLCNYESTFKNCAFDLPHSYADNGNELNSFLKIYFHEKTQQFLPI